MRRTRYGEPLPVQPRSVVSVLLVEPTQGYALNQPETDLQPGQTPSCVNYLMRDGALQLRPTLSQYTAGPNPVGPITGGVTVVSSTGSFYPLVSGMTQLAYYSNASWSSPLSYVSAGGMNAPLSTSSVQFTDIVQSYDPASDNMVAIIAPGSYDTLMTWAVGTGIYSSITSAPKAKYVAGFDNFVIALNVQDAGSQTSNYIQRVQWSDRGDPLKWGSGSGSLAGFEDLLDAKGAGTRVMVADNRLVLFFEDEIWQGVRATGTSSFAFSAMDRSLGCPYPWTITNTPLGIFFLGRDLNVYLLGKDGGQAAPIGYPVQRHLRARIDNPERAWGLWDADTTTYQLWYPLRSGAPVAQEAVFLNVADNSWAPQTVVHNTGSFALQRGFVAFNQTSSGALTWNSLQSSAEVWNSVTSTWAQTGGTSSFAGKVVAVGDSKGTMYYFSNGTQDDGISIGARWRSAALAGSSPDGVKVLQEVRIDYQSDSATSLTLRASRDQGQSFDPIVTVPLVQSSQENTAVAHVYTVARYPTFEVQVESAGPKLYRFWAKMREGGR